MSLSYLHNDAIHNSLINYTFTDLFLAIQGLQGITHIQGHTKSY